MDHQPYSQEDLLKALEEGHLYDYVASHYYEMPKEDLKDVCLELIWSLGETHGKDGEKKALLAAKIELVDRWDI